jgi:hypothetical protein
MFLFQHAEADEAAEFPGEGALRGNFAGRFGLVEAWLVMTDYPEGQGQSARSPEELPAVWVPEIVSSTPELGSPAQGWSRGTAALGQLRLRHDQLS